MMIMNFGVFELPCVVIALTEDREPWLFFKCLWTSLCGVRMLSRAYVLKCYITEFGLPIRGFSVQAGFYMNG